MSYLLTIALFVFFACSNTSDLAELNESFKGASASLKDDKLIISTGKITRQWKVTESGLKTVSLRDKEQDEEWIYNANLINCDWYIKDATEGIAEIKNVSVNIANDEGFTSEYLEVIVHLFYPQTKVSMQYIVWAYPDSYGLRTQLKFKGAEGFIAPVANDDPGIVERFPVQLKKYNKRSIRFHKYGAQRKDLFDKFPMMQEEFYNKGEGLPANLPNRAIMTLEGKGSSLVIVKEAPVIDNPAIYHSDWKDRADLLGYKTGGFKTDQNALSVTGTGIGAGDLLTYQYRKSWATWVVITSGTNEEVQLAIKKYDRIRYPLKSKYDMATVCNNWGSTNNSKDGKIASQEPSILEEINIAAEVGVEMVQVDDGWQNKNWGLDKKAYPEGWENIRQLADKLDVELGLWAAPQSAPLDSILKQFNTGRFYNLKLDFYRTSNYKQVAFLENYARTYVKHTGMKARINWDCTGPGSKDRGMFYSREYGNLWIENQKQHLPDHTLYKPWRVLQDFWLVSKYVNLNQLQIPVQYAYAHYPPESNAGEHSQSYLTAISLMGVPNFFQELKYLNEKARQEIKELLGVYKTVRDDMWKGFVFPVGEKPNDKSWTGFQSYNPETGSGYLTVFREFNNTESEKEIKLHFITNSSLEITDLLTNKKYNQSTDEYGNLNFNIEQPAGFLFLKYELLNDFK